MEKVVYESDKCFDRFPCVECSTKSVPTRVFVNYEKFDSVWLCYNCSDDYKKKGYQVLYVNGNEFPSTINPI